MYENLKIAVSQHTGKFICEQSHNNSNTKMVKFAHIITEPENFDRLPSIGDLKTFYSTFGSILFYYDSQSKDAGKYIARISEWSQLHKEFHSWFDSMDEKEREEYLPDWVGSALVVGETPASGNYIFIPTEGSNIGHVFEFDHDGFEFREQANNLAQYVKILLEPEPSTLVDMASSMRFIESDANIQWLIREFKDSNGHYISLRD